MVSKDSPAVFVDFNIVRLRIGLKLDVILVAPKKRLPQKLCETSAGCLS